MRSCSLVLLLFLSTSALADETNVCATTQSEIVEMLDDFSKQHDTKFVVDPRVAAKITLVGIGPSDITASTLIGILNLHGFTATEMDEIVNVMPSAVAEQSGDKFGAPWTG